MHIVIGNAYVKRKGCGKSHGCY